MTESCNFALRVAEPEDEAFLYEMFVASRERELAPLPEELRETIARQQYGIQQGGVEADYPDAQRFVVLGGGDRPGGPGAPVGMIILAVRPDTLWVVDVALHPGHRNRGLGAAVIGSLMDTCRQSGRTLKGSVTPYNPARRLYARLGIRELATERGYIALEWRPESLPATGRSS